MANGKDQYFLYFICYDKRHSPIKIGMTKCIKSRVGQLNTGSAWNLRLLIEFGFSSEATCRSAERIMHKLFHKDRLNGEWFSSNISIPRAYHFIESLYHDDKEPNYATYIESGTDSCVSYKNAAFLAKRFPLSPQLEGF